MSGALLVISSDGRATIDDLTAAGSVVLSMPVPRGGADVVLADQRIGPWLEAGGIVALDFAELADAIKVQVAIDGGGGA